MADQSERSVQFTGPRILADLVKLANMHKAKADTANGHIGQAIADAVENKHLHAQSFKLALRLYRMEPMKLGTFLEHFDYYREKLKLDDLKATDLFEEDESAEADEPASEQEGSQRKRGRKAAAAAAAPAPVSAVPLGTHSSFARRLHGVEAEPAEPEPVEARAPEDTQH